MNDFEKLIRKALIDRNMSIRDLAIALDISQAYIYDIFKGNRPGTKQKQRMIKFLGLEDVRLNADS